MASDEVINNTTTYIHCMLIPMQQHYLLLPNSTITEIIPRTSIDKPDGLNEGWLGYVEWLEERLPIIDLEGLITQQVSDLDSANKLCIISGINPDANIDSYAIPCTGSPQLITVNSAALHVTHNNLRSPYLHCQIKIGSKIAFIPNLDRLEAQIDIH